MPSPDADLRALPLPDVDDPEFAPFWVACRESRLVVQRCEACGRRRWPPRPACPACGSPATGWSEVTQEARLFSWTVVHASPLPGFAALVPYTVVIAELAESPALRMVGRLVGGGPEGLRVGMPLRASFERLSPDVVVPCWTTPPAA